MGEKRPPSTPAPPSSPPAGGVESSPPSVHEVDELVDDLFDGWEPTGAFKLKDGEAAARPARADLSSMAHAGPSQPAPGGDAAPAPAAPEPAGGPAYVGELYSFQPSETPPPPPPAPATQAPAEGPAAFFPTAARAKRISVPDPFGAAGRTRPRGPNLASDGAAPDASAPPSGPPPSMPSSTVKVAPPPVQLPRVQLSDQALWAASAVAFLLAFGVTLVAVKFVRADVDAAMTAPQQGTSDGGVGAGGTDGCDKVGYWNRPEMLFRPWKFHLASGERFTASVVKVEGCALRVRSAGGEEKLVPLSDVVETEE